MEMDISLAFGPLPLSQKLKITIRHKCNTFWQWFNCTMRTKYWGHDLGVVHNCQHLCIRTERTEGGGRGHDASVLFLNVDIVLMLPPGGYDWENAAPRDGLLRNCHLGGKLRRYNASFRLWFNSYCDPFSDILEASRETLGNVGKLAQHSKRRRIGFEPRISRLRDV